jgi:hypothetical protein
VRGCSWSRHSRTPVSQVVRLTSGPASWRFCEERAEAGEPAQAVVCWDGERLSRADSISTAACVSRLVEAGVSRMLTVEGWIDWAPPPALTPRYKSSGSDRPGTRGSESDSPR